MFLLLSLLMIFLIVIALIVFWLPRHPAKGHGVGQVARELLPFLVPFVLGVLFVRIILPFLVVIALIVVWLPRYLAKGYGIKAKGYGIKRMALELSPYLMPIALGFLYAPVNDMWTVKRFGCGCVVVDENGFRFPFNANDFNLILWSVVCLSCVGWKAYQIFSDSQRSVGRKCMAMAVGAGVIACICAFVWLSMLWL